MKMSLRCNLVTALAVFVATPSAFAACPAKTTPVQFAWENASGVGAKWRYGDTENTYNFNYTNAQGQAASVAVTVKLRDPDNINVDPDVRDPGKHPYDPAGACKPSTGETTDAWPGDGSFNDPWDSDCNGDPQKFSTGTNKAYGVPFFTWVLLSSHHEQTAYLDFTFSKPTYMDNFTVGDIDSAGLTHTYKNFINTEAPGNSYQDEVGFTATKNGVSVPVNLFDQGSGVIIDGTVVRSRYDTNQNYNVAPDDPIGTVRVKTAQPFDTFTFSYSNGKADADDEQTNPQLYTWWSNTKGATNGASDNHAVRLAGFTFCVAEPPKVDINLSKSVDKPNAKRGDTVVYTLTATNSGPDAASGVEIKDLLPTGLTYVSDDGGGKYNAVSGLWVVGDMANSESKLLKITAIVK